MKPYRILNAGEIIRKGDEYSLTSVWHPTTRVGSRVRKKEVGHYRREIKPKEIKPKSKSNVNPINPKTNPAPTSEWLDAYAKKANGTLRERIELAINCTSSENGSDTPDFILAEYLTDCLAVFDKAVSAREKWYGRNASPGSPIELPTPSEV